MSMQVTTRMARLGVRLVAVGRRHREIESRIADVEKRPLPDQFALQRLKREKLRLKDEMHWYGGLLRKLSRDVPA